MPNLNKTALVTGDSITQSTEHQPTNNAVWLSAERIKFEIKPAPYTPARENEIVIKNRAVAINPVDWIMQVIGDLAMPWIKYPFILGSDVAGEVVEVGRSVSRFKIGHRVLGQAVGADKKRNNSAESGFQQYTVLLEHMAAPIPGGMKYEDAAVLPLGLSTAACGLFEKDHLALQYPSSKPTPTGKTVLIWGGSTSVGSNAIQLAVASGYEVITTASPVNFDYVKKLGASEVFDYKSKTVVQDIIEAFKARIIAGALAIGAGSSKPCLDIVHASKGAKFVSLASAPMSFDRAPIPRKISWLIPIAAQMVATNVSLTLDAWMKGIKTNFIFATSLMWNEVGRMIYVDFLPSALADGTYKTAPEPLVVGEGLDQILTGLAIQKNGVSAKKVVIKL